MSKSVMKMQTIDDIGSFTIQHVFRNSVAKFPNQPALSLVGKVPMTYAELFEEVKKYASLLKHVGIKKGDKVAILSPSMPKWGVAYFAIVCLGAIAVPLLPDFNKSEVEGIIRHSDACFAFVSKNNREKLAGCTTLRYIYCLEDDAFLSGESIPEKITPVDLFAEHIDEQEKKLVAVLEKKNPEGLANARQTLKQERLRRAEERQRLLMRLKEIGKWALDSEVTLGKMESLVTLQVGDQWNRVMGVEIILKDGIVAEIREGGTGAGRRDG